MPFYRHFDLPPVIGKLPQFTVGNETVNGKSIIQILSVFSTGFLQLLAFLQKKWDPIGKLYITMMLQLASSILQNW